MGRDQDIPGATRYDATNGRRCTAGTKKILYDENFDSRVILLSFNWNVLAFLKKMAPQIPTAYISVTAEWFDNIKIGQPGPSPWMAGIDVDDYQESIPHSINAAGGKIWCAWSESLTRKRGPNRT